MRHTPRDSHEDAIYGVDRLERYRLPRFGAAYGCRGSTRTAGCDLRLYPRWCSGVRSVDPSIREVEYGVRAQRMFAGSVSRGRPTRNDRAGTLQGFRCRRIRHVPIRRLIQSSWRLRRRRSLARQLEMASEAGRLRRFGADRATNGGAKGVCRSTLDLRQLSRVLGG